MANANYQTPETITFYPSWLQYAYAVGLIESISCSNEDVPQEELYKLLSVDPSVVSEYKLDENEIIRIKFNSAVPSNLDFGMFLGHNNLEAKTNLEPVYWRNTTEDDAYAATLTSPVNIVNFPANGTAPSYNGWSAFSFSGSASANGGLGFKQTTATASISADVQDKLGCFILGKKWEAPQNIDVNNSYELRWGAKQKRTTSGKVISNLNYYKSNKWLLDAWELSDAISDTRNVATESRNGVRTWKVKWSFLAQKYAQNQNYMNTYVENWTTDDDDNYISSNGASSYSGTDGIDFTTSVLRLTMGNHLPLVVRISESNNSDQWAIVRIKRHSIRQKNPKLIDVSLTLEEQI